MKALIYEVKGYFAKKQHAHNAYKHYEGMKGLGYHSGA